jgi:hypothetical protein
MPMELSTDRADDDHVDGIDCNNFGLSQSCHN